MSKPSSRDLITIAPVAATRRRGTPSPEVAVLRLHHQPQHATPEVHSCASPCDRVLGTDKYRTSKGYDEEVHTAMRGSYGSHYRRMLPKLLDVLKLQSNNENHRPLLEAIEMLKARRNEPTQFYKLMTDADMRALSPLVYAHVNPYGLFELNMDERIDLERKMVS